MAYCAFCGKEMAADATFCPSCGKPAAGDQQQPPAYQPPAYSGAQQASVGSDSQEVKAMSIIAYIIFFIPLIVGTHKKSEFVKFHTNQGLVLFLLYMAFGIVYGILLAIFAAIFLSSIALWGVYSIVTTILSILWLAPAALMILGIVNAATNKMKPLPVIGKITILK